VNCTAATRVLPKSTSRCRMISAIVPRTYIWKSLYNRLEDESTTNTTSASLRHCIMLGSVTNLTKFSHSNCTSASARRISKNAGGTVKTMCNTLAPRPIPRSTFPSLIVCLSLCLVLCLFRRSRPPVTPVFFIISSFLYVFIVHVVALHPVYHRSTVFPRVLVPSILSSKTVRKKYSLL